MLELKEIKGGKYKNEETSEDTQVKKSTIWD